ncbi:TIGR01777 family oxidoreductase [Pelagicoccus sp. SDUM812003]|uniref:TIGR01777 family oxidoreductase n=1 Tax=Pelagicoccus sp. SDUM812003 TaxID=3041267 RepID=UPI00280FB4F3|nr:TIGR01777 family oxidoreductase [Pelagicoccus sp. SDUM812003]MDQ8203667.1 TIGR01777 family oxidoreductase [Pelagicoccus sp. SDUM812003]
MSSGVQTFRKQSEVALSAKELFAWHGRPGAFLRLSPPWEKVELLREDEGLGVGKRIEISLKTPFGRRSWKGEHVECENGSHFVDTQVQGPFRSWNHRHRFEWINDTRCRMSDEIEYELPLGGLGRGVAGSMVREKLERMFEYRHQLIASDVAFRKAAPATGSLRVLVAGGSGFLGQQLIAFLGTQGHRVQTLTRHPKKPGDIRWDPAKGEIELARLEGFDAVISLMGQSLFSGRWSEERKQGLWKSRVDATQFLITALTRLESPPNRFLGGSAVGFYGQKSDGLVDESAKRGAGFLADLCDAWEAAAYRAESLGCRVALLRTGVVLDPRGGALAQMLPAFRLGLGGPLGDGQQGFPWIALEDWVKGVTWTLLQPKLHGPVNLTAPETLSQGAFARKLGARLRRPAILPAPQFALRGALGQMADELLLSDLQIYPRALENSKYPFQLPKLDDALAFSLA